jgi:phosphatidylinositol alpha-1,6-mannosyltransferase
MYTVAIFSNLFPPVVSGSSTQSAELSRQLARRGYKVIVITANLNASKEYENVDGVEIYRLPSIHLPRLPIALNFPWLNFTYTFDNLKRIEKILEENSPDIIHLHNHMFDLSFAAVWAKKKYQVPLVITIHTAIKHPVRFYNLFLYPLDRLLINRTVIQKSDILVCPELTIREYVSDAFKIQEVAIIPYGVNILPEPDPVLLNRLKDKYLLHDKRVILSIGHLHEIRNRREIIEALPRIHERFPNVVLLIMGDVGTKSAEVLAKKLGVSDSVIFTGSIPYEQIATYMGLGEIEAHWFQESNPQSKTLGIAALEAMSAGKVVINTADEDVYGKGVLKDGQNYIKISPGNPEQVAQVILGLLKNPEECLRIGQNACSTIQKHFSWDTVSMMTMDLYQKLRE